MGPHDLVREIGRELGVEEIFWRIAMRPGKPLSFSARGSTLMFGLPGNPVSTLVCFELFVRPALYALQGAHSPAPDFATRKLMTTVKRNPERDDLIRVLITGDGSLEPLRGQQSHQITTTATPPTAWPASQWVPARFQPGPRCHSCRYAGWSDRALV